MKSAARPAACGEAMLVPSLITYPPPVFVELIRVPGMIRSMPAPGEMTGFGVDGSPSQSTTLVL